MQENQSDSYSIEVGERLAEARRAVVPKMTQAAAAQHLGELMGRPYPPSRIGNYEQGTRQPHPQIVAALCQIYGTATPSYVLGFDEAPRDMREAVHLKKYRMADERGKLAIDSVTESQSAYEIEPGSRAKAG